MNGYTKIIIEEKVDVGRFPVVRKFTIEQDSTFESLDEWVDVFNQILQVKGFHCSARVGIIEEDETEYTGTEK